MNKPNLFKGASVSQAEFLTEFWHKRPLLLKNAIDLGDLNGLPNKSKLIQLSCKEDIQSRIVFKYSEVDYSVEFGPFIENEYDDLDQDTWNLLVSDVDKWQPQSREILKYFNFIRNWIFDDIMLSCGSKGGTVGPHTDHYDVFLIQVKGQRKWSYGTNKIYDPEIIPELDLKLMSQFDADETHILNPGDVLYIPPEVAHYGVAKSDDCVTCSIGMRTPSHSELMTSFIDHLAQEKSDNSRFEEPQFDKQPQIGEITSKDIDNISQILIENLNSEKKSLSDWFGQYITEYRSLFFEFNQYQDINNLSIEHDLQLSAFSKSCYFVNKDNADMFVNGQKFQSSLSLALAVCDDKIVTKSKLNKLSNNEQSIINTLFENGSLIQNLK